MNSDLILGWVLGVASSIISGIVLFWLQSRRDIQNEVLRQRREDIRIARNWAVDGKKTSLRGFDLRGANLSGKDFASADLEDANLDEARMWNTRLNGANLIHASFRNANLVGVDFSDAKLESVDFAGTTLREVNFTNTKLSRAKLHKPKKAENCIWRGASINDRTELTEQLRIEIEAAQKEKAAAASR
jgi:uncharacterized protein YjbI with pentapeptide repeats